MKIWRKITSRLDPSYLGWEYVRDVTEATSGQWLEVYRRDDPGAEFVVSDSRPRRRHGRKVMTGPGSTY